MKLSEIHRRTEGSPGKRKHPIGIVRSRLAKKEADDWLPRNNISSLIFVFVGGENYASFRGKGWYAIGRTSLNVAKILHEGGNMCR